MELLGQFILLFGVGNLLSALVSQLLAPSREEIEAEMQAQEAEAQREMWARFAADVARAEAAQAERNARTAGMRADARAPRERQMPPLVAEPQGDIPPMHLYHGAARQSFAAILSDGLFPDRTGRVTLANDIRSARQDAQPFGDFVILRILANDACQRGTVFAAGAAGVYTCERVEPVFVDAEWTIQEYVARTEGR